MLRQSADIGLTEHHPQAAHQLSRQRPATAIHHPLIFARNRRLHQHARIIPAHTQATQPSNLAGHTMMHLADSINRLSLVEVGGDPPGDQPCRTVRVRGCHGRLRRRTAAVTPTAAQVRATTPPTTAPCCSGLHGSPKLTASVMRAGIDDRAAPTAMLVLGLTCGTCSFDISAAGVDDTGPLVDGGFQDHGGSGSKVISFGTDS